MRAKMIAILSLTVGFLSSCADPLTKAMNDLGYTPLVPSPETQHLGDLYLYADVARFSDADTLIRNALIPADIAELEKRTSTPVDVPASSGEDTYKISADADIIGKAKLELEARGITRFSIQLANTKQYLLDHDTWKNLVLPKLKEARPNINLLNRFVIRGLLFAGSLNYTLYDEKGRAVKIEPGSEIEKVIKGKLGVSWGSTSEITLGCSNKFVGYKLGLIREASGDFKAMGGDPGLGEPGAASNEVLYVIEEVDPRNLRDTVQ